MSKQSTSDLGDALSLEEQIRHWFVLRTDPIDEIELRVRAISDSLVIEQLRSAYQKIYGATPEFTASELSEMSGEEQFAAKRELKRQGEFVEQFKNQPISEEADVMIIKIAGRANAEKIALCKSWKVPDDRNAIRYYFSSGHYTVRYSSETKQYEVLVYGTIPGRIAFLLKKSTPSGRRLDDALVVLEFENGVPAFVLQSSNGVQGLKDLARLKKAASKLQQSLARAPRVVERTPSEVEAKEGDGPSATMTEEEPSPEIKPVEQTKPLSALRAQLKQLREKKASARTIGYLIKQIALDEGVSVESVANQSEH